MVCILYFDKRIQSHSKFLSKKIRKGYKKHQNKHFYAQKSSEIFEKRDEKNAVQIHREKLAYKVLKQRILQVIELYSIRFNNSKRVLSVKKF